MAGITLSRSQSREFDVELSSFINFMTSDIPC